MKKILLAIFLMMSQGMLAQKAIRDSSISFPMLGFTFGYQMPGGDMADRFGNNFWAGGLFQYKLKSNWMIGVEGGLLFSEKVREANIITKYLTPDGNIIDGNGIYGDVRLYERGWRFDVRISKIFNFLGINPNSGLMTTIGVGALQHRILIDTPGSPIPYLEGDYRKGYDRLSNGLSITEFIGYMHFGNKRLVNFFAGIEMTQAFTKNRRPINFDTGLSETGMRNDFLFGIKAGWVFLLYKRSADKYYVN